MLFALDDWLLIQYFETSRECPFLVPIHTIQKIMAHSILSNQQSKQSSERFHMAHLKGVI